MNKPHRSSRPPRGSPPQKKTLLRKVVASNDKNGSIKDNLLQNPPNTTVKTISNLYSPATTYQTALLPKDASALDESPITPKPQSQMNRSSQYTGSTERNLKKMLKSKESPEKRYRAGRRISRESDSNRGGSSRQSSSKIKDSTPRNKHFLRSSFYDDQDEYYKRKEKELRRQEYSSSLDRDRSKHSSDKKSSFEAKAKRYPVTVCGEDDNWYPAYLKGVEKVEDQGEEMIEIREGDKIKITMKSWKEERREVGLKKEVLGLASKAYPEDQPCDFLLVEPRTGYRLRVRIVYRIDRKVESVPENEVESRRYSEAISQPGDNGDRGPGLSGRKDAEEITEKEKMMINLQEEEESPRRLDYKPWEKTENLHIPQKGSHRLQGDRQDQFKTETKKGGSSGLEYELAAQNLYQEVVELKPEDFEANCEAWDVEDNSLGAARLSFCDGQWTQGLMLNEREQAAIVLIKNYRDNMILVRAKLGKEGEVGVKVEELLIKERLYLQDFKSELLVYTLEGTYPNGKPRHIFFVEGQNYWDNVKLLSGEAIELALPSQTLPRTQEGGRAAQDSPESILVLKGVLKSGKELQNGRLEIVIEVEGDQSKRQPISVIMDKEVNSHRNLRVLDCLDYVLTVSRMRQTMPEIMVRPNRSNKGEILQGIAESSKMSRISHKEEEDFRPPLRQNQLEITQPHNTETNSRQGPEREEVRTGVVDKQIFGTRRGQVIEGTLTKDGSEAGRYIETPSSVQFVTSKPPILRTGVQIGLKQVTPGHYSDQEGEGIIRNLSEQRFNEIDTRKASQANPSEIETGGGIPTDPASNNPNLATQSENQPPGLAMLKKSSSPNVLHIEPEQEDEEEEVRRFSQRHIPDAAKAPQREDLKVRMKRSLDLPSKKSEEAEISLAQKRESSAVQKTEVKFRGEKHDLRASRDFAKKVRGNQLIRKKESQDQREAASYQPESNVTGPEKPQGGSLREPIRQQVSKISPARPPKSTSSRANHSTKNDDIGNKKQQQQRQPPLPTVTATRQEKVDVNESQNHSKGAKPLPRTEQARPPTQTSRGPSDSIPRNELQKTPETLRETKIEKNRKIQKEENHQKVAGPKTNRSGFVEDEQIKMRSSQMRDSQVSGAAPQQTKKKKRRTKAQRRKANRLSYAQKTRQSADKAPRPRQSPDTKRTSQNPVPPKQPQNIQNNSMRRSTKRETPNSTSRRLKKSQTEMEAPTRPVRPDSQRKRRNSRISQKSSTVDANERSSSARRQRNKPSNPKIQPKSRVGNRRARKGTSKSNRSINRERGQLGSSQANYPQNVAMKRSMNLSRQNFGRKGKTAENEAWDLRRSHRQVEISKVDQSTPLSQRHNANKSRKRIDVIPGGFAEDQDNFAPEKQSLRRSRVQGDREAIQSHGQQIPAQDSLEQKNQVLAEAGVINQREEPQKNYSITIETNRVKTEDKREDRNLVVDEPNQERLASAAVEDENQGDEDAEIDPLESSAPKFKELFKDETMYNRFIEFYETLPPGVDIEKTYRYFEAMMNEIVVDN